MREHIGKKAIMDYESMKMKLTEKQVLMPRLRWIVKETSGPIQGSPTALGYEIVGWKLRNIRRMDLGDIEKIMKYASEQLTESKLNRLINREERLKKKYGLTESIARYRNQI